VRTTFCLVVSTVWLGSLPTWAGERELVAFPENGSTLTILEGDEAYLDISFMGWEPNWKFMGFRGSVREEDGGTVLVSSSEAQASGASVTITARVRKSGPRRLTLDAEVRTTQDTDLVYIVAAVGPSGQRFEGGKVVAAYADGSRKEIGLPLKRKGLGDGVREMTLVDTDGEGTRVSLSPPCTVPSDEVARVVLAEGTLEAAAPSKVTMTIDLPGEVTYFAGPSEVPFEPGFEDWFAFEPDDDPESPSEIGMEDWLEAPAGKHGRIARRDDQLVYDGKPIKLWGLNLCYSACAPEKELAEKRASFYAKYGINAVRLHKYADGPGWAGIQSEESFVRFDPEGLDRMDYLVAQLKQRGIYVKLSAHFGSQKLGPADKRYVPYLEEFGSFSGRKKRITTPHSAVHYSPELQQVQIRQMVNLLQHKNPYTGHTYAEDPAVAFLEIINEQSILFFTSMSPLEASPTLREHVAKRFSDWLREKYGTHEKLERAWGGGRAFDSFQDQGFSPVGEHLDKNNILPLGNPWYWDPAQLAGSQAFRKRRLMDTLLFLYGLQNEFYARYVRAMRDAGYEGEIVASNWQAGRALSHFYNLHSDALVGTIDRHNYFGGGSTSRINDATMLAVPGSGTLSAGMQQVADRPFMLSEWIHVRPNEWGVEGPAIIGAYGMGLQGWDVSFMFQNRDRGAFREEIHRDRWEVTAPNVLGVFPAVARQVLRGDVAESEVLAPCYVHVPSLDEGKLGFEDQVTQQYDVKTFGTDKVPAETLAVARCVVDFTDAYRDTPAFDLAPFVRDRRYTSSTGQLRWKPGQSRLDGFFTLNADATKAVVGFAEGEACRLGDVTIEPKCRYAAIYLTAKEPDRDLGTSNHLLVVAVARARNSGMKVFAGSRILDRGRSPVVMEPVKAEITIRRQGSPTVYLLDASGRRTDRTLPVRDGGFEIDGARDKTCYYLVSYPG
jgi:hypothetical protein